MGWAVGRDAEVDCRNVLSSGNELTGNAALALMKWLGKGGENTSVQQRILRAHNGILPKFIYLWVIGSWSHPPASIRALRQTTLQEEAARLGAHWSLEPLQP